MLTFAVTFALSFKINNSGALADLRLWAQHHPGGEYLFAEIDFLASLAEAVIWANEAISTVLGEAPHKWTPQVTDGRVTWMADVEVE